MAARALGVELMTINKALSGDTPPSLHNNSVMSANLRLMTLLWYSHWDWLKTVGEMIYSIYFILRGLHCREQLTITFWWGHHNARHAHAMVFPNLQVVTNSVIAFVSDSTNTPTQFRWYLPHTVSKWDDLGCIGNLTMRHFFWFGSQL